MDLHHVIVNVMSKINENKIVVKNKVIRDSMGKGL